MDHERKTLRRRLARRQRQKAEMEHRYRAAQRQYQKEIAPLQEEVLRLQMEHLRRVAQRYMRSAKHRNAYHDAQRAYESFQEAASDPDALSPEAIKRRYRRASKRCHPDLVPVSFREEAVATFQALEAAYERGHGRAVDAIATSLERWGFPREEDGLDAEDRDAAVRRLRAAISDLESSMQEIRGTDAYQDLEQAGDLDALLQAQKEALRRRLQNLRQR